jgi:hypothetical protein
MLTARKIRSIAAFAEPVLTVYLNTRNPDPSRHPLVPDDLAWLRKEAETLGRDLDSQDAKQFNNAFARVEDFLDGRHPQEQSLALFTGLHTWAVIPLPIAVENEIHWGKPATGQLSLLLGEHNRYGAVVVDRRTARFFEFYLGELTALDEKPFDVGQIVTERMHKGHGPDLDLYAHRLDAQYERLWHDAAKHAVSLAEEHSFAGTFLIGSEEIISSIRKHLTSPAATHVVMVPEDLGQFSPTEICRRLEPLVAEYEQNLQLAEVRELLAADAGSVSDPDEALAKLQVGMIGTLLLAEGHELHLRECSKCRTVSRTSDNLCSECGGDRRNVGMFETLARLASTHGTRLEFLRGKAGEMLAKAGGMAGKLRQQKKTARL